MAYLNYTRELSTVFTLLQISFCDKCVLVAHHRRRQDWQQKGQLERRHGISE